jgi:hypothetical protein
LTQVSDFNLPLPVTNIAPKDKNPVRIFTWISTLFEKCFHPKKR